MSEYTYEYLPTRGITTDTFRFYDCKTKVNAEGKPIEVGFPFPNDWFQVRTLDSKDFRIQPIGGSRPGCFGVNKFSTGAHRYVTITEGVYDALSLYQVLGKGGKGGPVVSVQSSQTALRDCRVDYDFLNSHERIYLAFDGDGPGREAARSVASLFDYNKVFLVKFTKRKDANEYLQAGEAHELEKIWWNSRKYLPDTIVSTFEEFRQALVLPTMGFPYPSQKLTEMTYGIRKGETVLVTAQEKVGKTEFLHFLEHKILKETNDNVGAIFLEEPKSRHLQALAGIELGVAAQLPDSGLTEDDIMAAVKSVVGKDDRLHLYSHFGSDDPGVILETVRFLVSARACDFILFDHIGLSVSGLQGEDERKALDYISTRLEMMVKELNFALIMVSHLNDNGQTRGSRWLTKICDVNIKLERDSMNPDPIERNKLHLSVPYNRFCSSTGEAGSLVFDQSTYRYTEMMGANDNAYTPKDQWRTA